MKISYHSSHEQFSPRELVSFVRQAEEAGFDAAFSSDHFHPWAPAQGHSGFIWAWLGAALQATSKLSFAGITIPGGWRFHPAIVAQALATLDDLYPERLPWFALGSGERLNEHVVGREWPDPKERGARLAAAADIIRKLLAGERVTQRDRIPVEDAQLWPPSKHAIQLMGAAMSASTAESVGSWADGLLTTAPDMEALKKIVSAFRRSAPDKPMHLKVDISWAPDQQTALRQAHEEWRYLTAGREASKEWKTPEEFDRNTRQVTPEDMRRSVLISADLDQHIEWLRARAALGFETLNLHNVGRNQSEFIAAFGRHVLPALRS
jgi:coenzyme F420-dependent glucose-6-phosphate dehydrogenase